jgi:hypothetical protein
VILARTDRSVCSVCRYRSTASKRMSQLVQIKNKYLGHFLHWQIKRRFLLFLCFSLTRGRMQYIVFISALFVLSYGQYVVFPRYTDAECKDLVGYEIHPQTCARRDTNTSGSIDYATYTCSGDNVIKQVCRYAHSLITFFFVSCTYLLTVTHNAPLDACKLSFLLHAPTREMDGLQASV